MEASFVFVIWMLNFGISIWNAYVVGTAWVETKHYGGWPRFMSWMGAIMSASGFTWCYLILLGFVGHGLGWLTLDDLVSALSLGYILLIPGILFSGLMITLDSWARAYRTRTISSIGVAAWNTYAQIHNTYHAINSFGKAFKQVVGSSSLRRGKGAAIILVIVLVVVALLSGVITTTLIIRRVAGDYKLPEPGQQGETPKSPWNLDRDGC